MSDPLPDLSWEEIARNIEQIQQANANRPGAVNNTYLEEIKVVNDALRRGVALTIRVARHGFTCLPGELLPIENPPSDGCLLVLRKVVVEFRQENHSLITRITLRFWDTTHEQEDIWGAMSVQPQWESILQQAQDKEHT